MDKDIFLSYQDTKKTNISLHPGRSWGRICIIIASWSRSKQSTSFMYLFLFECFLSLFRRASEWWWWPWQGQVDGDGAITRIPLFCSRNKQEIVFYMVHSHHFPLRGPSFFKPGYFFVPFASPGNFHIVITSNMHVYEHHHCYHAKDLSKKFTWRTNIYLLWGYKQENFKIQVELDSF